MVASKTVSKTVVLIPAVIALLLAGSVCLYISADAREEYKAAELSVNLSSGENSKEMQKVNDSKQRLEPLKNKWTNYRTFALVCFVLAIPAFIVNLIFWLKKPKGKSKNVSE